MEVNLKKQEHLKLFAFLFVPLLSLIYDLENIGSLLTLELQLSKVYVHVVIKCFRDTFPTLILNFKKIGSHIYFRSTAFEIGDSPKFELEIPQCGELCSFEEDQKKCMCKEKTRVNCCAYKPNALSFFYALTTLYQGFIFPLDGSTTLSVITHQLVSIAV